MAYSIGLAPTATLGTTQHWPQRRPYGLEDLRLRLRVRVQAVLLNLARVECYRVQKKGNERQAVLFGEFTVQAMKLSCVGRAVVGRNAHSKKQDLGAALTRGFDHQIGRAHV